MVASGHHRVAIKFLHGAQDSLVIGGHQHARNVLGATHTLPYVLNHWLLRQPHQRFARKAAGSVARGNDGQHAQLVTPVVCKELAAAPKMLPHPLCARLEEHTSELQSLAYLVCRLLLEKKKELQSRHLKTRHQNTTH